MQWIVRVGTDKETANPAYAEFAGYDLFGPFEEPDKASDFARQVRTEFSVLAHLDPHGFVYGQVSVDVLPLKPVSTGLTGTLVAKRAAGNWHLDKDDRD